MPPEFSVIKVGQCGGLVGEGFVNSGGKGMSYISANQLCKSQLVNAVVDRVDPRVVDVHDDVDPH